LFAGELHTIDLKGTPVPWEYLYDIREDGGDVIFITRKHRFREFRLTQGVIRLHIDPPPRACGATLTLRMSVTPRRFASGMRFYAEIDDGPFVPAGSATTGTVTLAFARGGEHTCVLSGMRNGCRTPQGIIFRVTGVLGGGAR